MIDKIYRDHHILGRRYGHTEIASVRIPFFVGNIGTGKRVLDLGCRDGVLTDWITPNNEVLGIDVDPVAVQSAQRRGIHAIQRDLNDEWNELGYDVVMAGEVIEHLYMPEDVFFKVKRTLVDGGLFIGTVPNAFSWRNRFKYLLGRKDGTPLSDPTHINHFSKKELKRLLQKHFINVRVVADTHILFFTAYK